MRTTATAYVLSIIFLLSFHTSNGASSQSKKDSLQSLVHTATVDSLKADAYNALALLVKNSSPDSALVFADSAASVSIKASYTDGIAAAANNAASVYMSQGDYSKSIEKYLLGVKLIENKNRPRDLAGFYLNIGTIYLMTNNFSQALDYYQKAQTTFQALKDNQGLFLVYNNMSMIYGEQKNYPSSLDYAQRALKVAETQHNQENTMMVSLNIGETYYWLGNYQDALTYTVRALNYYQIQNNQLLLSAAHLLVGKIKEAQHAIPQAIAEFNLTVAIATKTNNKEDRKEAYQNLAHAYEALGNYKSAYTYKSLYASLKDSLLNEQSSKQINELQAKYDLVSKNKEISLLNKDKALKAIELERDKSVVSRQRIILTALIAGFVFLAIGLAFVFRLYSQKKKAALELAQAYEQIEKKNTLITESINYAKKIQDSLLTDQRIIKQQLPNAFIYFQPKDIVIGDFYWYAQKEGRIFFAVADCAGHGVPGAMMTMIAHALLNEVIQELTTFEPTAMLVALNRRILAMPHSTGEAEHSSGIAISLMVLDTECIQIATAHQSVYRFTDAGMVEITGPTLAVGGIKDEGVFKACTFPRKEKAFYYFASDGFQDQFGGPKRKKFMKQPFQELLHQLSALTPDDQQSKLSQVFTEWKGQHEQTDDVLIAGFSV